MNQGHSRSETVVQKQHQITCKQRLKECCYSFCSSFADYFECDRQFHEMEIAPHRVHFIKNENVLDPMQREKSLDQLQLNKTESQQVWVNQSESTKWERLSSWTWWRTWLCCPYYQEDDFELQTQYELRQHNYVNNEKDLESLNVSNIENKKHKHEMSNEFNQKDDNIVFMYDSLSPQNNLNSIKNTNKISDNSKLNACLIKVQPKQQFTNVGMRRKKQRESNISKQSNQSNNTNQESDLIQASLNFKSNDIPFQNNQNHYGQIDLSNTNTYLKMTSNKSDSLQSQSQCFSTKKLNSLQRSANNVSSFISNNNISNINMRKRYQSEVIQQQTVDNVQKRRKKTCNPFEESIAPDQQFNVQDQNPQQDFSKKKRRKRKQIKQQAKDQEQRAKKREQDMLAIVLFEEDQI